MKRWLKRLSLVLLIGLILTLLMAGWGAGTETGSHWLIRLAQRWIPGELTIQHIEGSLLNRLVLKNIHYKHEAVNVDADSLILAWQANALFDLNVHVQQIIADKVKVVVPPSTTKPAEPSKEPFSLPEIRLPISVALDDVQLTEFELQTGEASAPFQLKVAKAQLSATIKEQVTLSKLSISGVQMQGIDAALDANGHYGLTRPHPVLLDLQWTAKLPEAGEVIGKGQLTGDIQKLTLNHQISNPIALQLNLSATDVLNNLGWQADIQWQDLFYPLDNSAKVIRSQDGKITSSGQLSDYKLQLQTRLSGKDVPATALQLDAKGNLHSANIEKLQADLLDGHVQAQGAIDWQNLLQANLQLDIQQLRINDYVPDLPKEIRLNNKLQAQLNDKQWQLTQETALSNTPTQIQLNAKGSIQSLDNPDFDVTLDWKNLQYPLVGASVVNVPTGTATLTGNLQAYQLDLKTQVKTSQIPDSHWQLNAQGDLGQLKQGKLTGDLLQGQLLATLSAQWADKLQAAVDVQLSDIALAPLVAELPPNVKVNASFSADLQNDKVKIQQGKISLPPTDAQITLAGEGLLQPADNTTFKADLTWKNLQFPLIGVPQVQTQAGSVKLAGTLQTYQLTLNTDLSGEQLPKGTWQAEINGNAQQIKLDKLRGEFLQGLVNANGLVELSPLKANLALSLDKLVLHSLVPEIPATHKLTTQLRAEFANQQVQLTELNLSLPPSLLKITGQAEADLNNAQNPSFKTKLTWQGVRYPFEGKELLLKDAKGHIALNGTAENYQLELLTDIVGQGQIPSGKVIANGNGDKNSFKLKQLQGKLLDGILNLTGQVAWSPAVQWTLNLNGEKLNLAPYTQQASNIALDIRSTGKLDNNQLKADIDIANIKGKIGTYPVQLQATASAQGQQFELKKFNFVSGKNRVTAQASYAKTLNATWEIDAPALAELVPQTGGSLQGKGKISGTLTNPNINATLQGKQLAYADKRLADLDLKINADLQGKQGIDLSLQATDIFQANEKVINSVNLTGQGQIGQHRVALTVKAPENNLQVNIDGGFNLNTLQWQGQISQIVATIEQMGTWSLPKPAPLTVSPDMAQLSNFCLQGYLNRRQPDSLTSICALGGWQAKTGANAELSLSKIPLRLFVPTVTGTLEGRINGTYQNNGSLRANALIDISKGRLLPATDDPNTKPIDHNGGKIKLTIDEQGLNGEILLDLARQNAINGSIVMQGFNRLPINPNQPITARLQANFNDLSLLPDILSQAEKAKGAATLNVSIDGNIADPIVQGQFLIKQVEVGLPDLGLQIKDLNADIKTISRDTIDIKMGFQSGDGKMDIAGNVKLLTLTDWQSTITIKGDNVQVINTPDAVANITPDLRLNMSTGKIDLSGKVTIPYANITPTGATISGSGSGGNTVASSPDVVIVNPDKPSSTAEKATKGWAITSQLTVILGDDIRLAVMDFNSHLTGALSITLSPNQTMPRATGELQILDGTYRAYGQDLEIERGRIIFAGGGVDNPVLNIEAIRKIRDRTKKVESAGVRIRGTAQAPQLSLFSTPSVPESDILSYIITGSALGEDVSNAMLSLGTYLTPQLYVGYGLSLVDQNRVFNIRYELSRKWGIEASIGTEDKGADFSYILEW